MNDIKERHPVSTLFEAVAFLHKKGYEKIRLMSYYGPSGGFRVEISLKKNFDNKTGFILCRNEDNETFRYSAGRSFRFFNDDILSMENASIEEIAGKLLKEKPILEKEGKGEDKEYVDWFAKVLKMTENRIFPYAFAEYGYNIYSEGKIMFTNHKDSIEYAPPGEFVRKSG